MNNSSITFLNLVASILFILSLRGLASPRSSYRSNILGIIGMVIALIPSLSQTSSLLPILSVIFLGGGIGIIIAQTVKMTALPQTVAAFNGLGGLSAFLIAYCEIGRDSLNVPIGAIIGIFTFSGSFIAFAKLQGLIKKNFNHIGNKPTILLSVLLIAVLIKYSYSDSVDFATLSIIAFLLGTFITLRIGGADMPIIISILNAGSGLASSAVGFMLNNQLLIITGALVGASGSILAYVMCKAMNRSLLHVLFGSYNNTEPTTTSSYAEVKIGNPSEAAFLMENAQKIIIIPGYGMAVAQAQHTLKQMAELLRNKYNVTVKFAIHPVAGRMPGHMNVLLAEANIPYDDIFELEDINNEFASADIAYVIGANDITNPSAKTDSSSPIYGMPILEVDKAKTIFFVKRSMSTGYAGLDNPLFFADNTIMLFGDAQKVTSEIVKDLEH